jgi:hypothetical protein
MELLEGCQLPEYLRQPTAQSLEDTPKRIGSVPSRDLLTEDGPPVRELAEARLTQLQKPGA